MKHIITFFILLLNTAIFSQNNCLHFDGSNDDVSIAYSSSLDFSLNSQFTVEFWFNTSAATAVMYSNIDPTSFAGIDFGIYNGQLFGEVSNNLLSGNMLRVETNSTFNDGSWHHLAYVYTNQTSLVIYVDGLLQPQTVTHSFLSGSTNSSAPTRIGSRAGGYFFSGYMDEVRVWSRILCGAEIFSHKNCNLTGAETNLAAYYNFNSGIAAGNNSGLTTLTDITPNNLTGTLSLFSLSGAFSNWVSSGASISGTCVSSLPSLSISATSPTLCSGKSTTLTAVLPGATSYSWSTGATNANISVSPTVSTIYTVSTSGGTLCAETRTILISVSPNPTINASGASICSGSAFTINPTGATSYSYSGGSAVVSPTTTTTYTVVGTNTFGCISNTIGLTLTVTPIPFISVSSGSICSGQSFNINPSGASNYTYSSGTAIVNPTSTSIYTVIGSAGPGCLSNVASLTVTVNASPTVDVNSGFVCLGSSFTLAPSGAVTYSYSGGSAIVTPIINTSYTVTGYGAGGCSSSTVANIGVVATPTLAITGSTSVCVGNSTTLNANGANFYTWSTGATTSSIAVNPSSTTIYTVSGVNIFGCFSSKVLTVTVNPLPTITVNSGSICSGKSFTMNPGGAFTYSYSSGSNIVSPLSNTSYSVTGTSAQGCISAGPAISNVNVVALPIIAANSGTSCAGSPFVITPTGGVTYTYSGGSATISPVVSTNYTVTGAANGCTATSISSVTVISLPVISITGSASICNGNTATLTANGAVTYSWSTAASTSTISASPTSNTSYTAYGFDANGCRNFAVRIVTVNAIPVVSVTSGSICSGKSFTMVASGASTYTYSSGSNIVSPLSNTSYSVTGTSAAGCVSSNTAVSIVNVTTSPVITVNSGTSCAGQSFTMNPSGGISYVYSGGSAVVSPVTTTQYTVTGTNAGGCSSAAISTVVVSALPVVTINSPSVICIGSTTVLTANGANSYVWNTSATTQTLLVSPVITTTYSVIGLALTGCTNSAVKVLTVSPLPVITVNSGSVCSGSSFTMNPGGASTYTYSSGSNIVSPLSDTSYSITGTSAQGCASSNTVVSSVTVVSLPLVSVNSGSVCAGKVFTMNPSGAVNYTYSNGSSTVIPAGNTSYTVTGANAQGCISKVVSSVTMVALPVVSVNSGSICSGNIFTINPFGASSYTIAGNSSTVSPATTTNYAVTGTSSVGCISNPVISSVTVHNLPFISVNSGTICSGDIFTISPSGASSYIYSNGSNTVIPTVNASYTVTGLSAQGCPSSNSVVSSVTLIALPALNVNSGEVCDGSTFIMNPTGAITYTFSNGSNTVIPTVNSSYTITGTSSVGCISNPVVSSVTVHAIPSVSISGNAVICSGQTTTLTALGASTYTWSNAVISPSIFISIPNTTTYSVIGASAFGCTNSALQSVIINTVPIISASSAVICSGTSYVINPSGAFTYTYSSGSATVSPAVTTVYSIIGTSPAGCITPVATSITIYISPLPPVYVTTTNTICSGGTAVLTASGGATYTWSTGYIGTNLSVTPSVTTIYTVTATSAFGCTNTALQTIIVNATPTINVNSGAVCPGNSFTFNPTGAGSYTYQGGSNVVSPLSTSNYTVIGTNSNGCVSQPAVGTVSVVNVLTVTVIGNTLICEGETTNLLANGASSYLWSTGSSTDIVSVSPVSNTSYTVMGISGTCSDVAVVSVSVNPSPTVTVNSGSICPGNSFTLIAGGAVNYTYSSLTPIVSPLVNATYTVVGTGSNGCLGMALANVAILPTPALSISSSVPDMNLCEGQEVVLSGSGAVAYTWINEGVNINVLNISPTDTTTYSLTGQDGNGCSDTISVTLFVNDCTGLKDITNTITKFSIYPNPNNGSFFIEQTSVQHGKIVIEDVEGKTLYSYEVNQSSKPIELKNLGIKPGIYFCRIISDGNSVVIKKLIITN